MDNASLHFNAVYLIMYPSSDLGWYISIKRAQVDLVTLICSNIACDNISLYKAFSLTKYRFFAKIDTCLFSCRRMNVHLSDKLSKGIAFFNTLPTNVS